MSEDDIKIRQVINIDITEKMFDTDGEDPKDFKSKVDKQPSFLSYSCCR